MSEPRPPSRPARPTALRRWLSEMRRRQVLRVIGVYGAGSLVILEAADLIFPLIPLPPWTVRWLFWAAVVGFPVAVALSWAFDLTPEGLRRTAPADTDALAPTPATSALVRSGTLALVGVALFGLGFYGGFRSEPDRADPAAERTDDPGMGPSGPSYVALSDDPRPAIAVLPFADMSPSGDQRYFSDGISEEILTVLSRVRGIRVASRSSAFAYDARDADLRVVGDELGVPFLLAGAVRKDGDQLRITAELVNTSDGFRIWTDTYDRRLESVFAVQSEIAEAIAGALRVPLGLGREDLVSPTLDMEAHDLYLSARTAMRRRGTGLAEAIRLFEAAVAQDPDWAPAWAGLAEAQATLPLYGVVRGESTDSAFWANHLAAAEVAAQRALELDPDNASARVALGIALRDRWQWKEAESQFLGAIALDPDSEEAHLQYSELLWGTGRLDESLRETSRALALDRAPIFLDAQAFVLGMNGRPAEAEPLLEEGIEEDPSGDVHFLRTVYASIMLLDGRYREALRRFSPFLSDTVGYRRLGEALEAGDPDLVPGDAGRGTVQVLTMLGARERALDELEAMVFAMPYRVQYDIWDPVLAPLRETRRFQEVILPRVRLEGVTVRYDRGDAPR